ncbi:MAG: TetR/AcrR family transcriptional regulator [Ardenticatenaceae bacterium]|nr:TetR/AcrR family transcriptional regulator [Ardenticatenaceae bacterium]
MSKELVDSPLDPRVRRTRRWLQKALVDLLREKSFSEISITDMTKQADLARVTFYQHFESKEALLLTLVSDFFAQMYQVLDAAKLKRFIELGNYDDVQEMQLGRWIDPAETNHILIALRHIGPAVRQLAVVSFLNALSQIGYQIADQEAEALATYHVSGVLSLLEIGLNSDLAVSQEEISLLTLRFMRILIQDGLESGSIRRPIG